MYYRSLFNFNIHHGYFLDNGQEKFLPPPNNNNGMSDADKEEALKKYDFSEYMRIKPTKATQKLLKNHRMLMKVNKQGFTVVVDTQKVQDKYEPIIPLQDELTLTFELQATDNYFYNYTNVTNLTNNRMYLFTNVKPSAQGSFENVFENNGGFVDGSFLLKEQATRDLVRAMAEDDEQFTTVTSQFSLANSIRLIEEDDTLTNNEKEDEIELLLNGTIQRRKKKSVVGYVRLTIKGDAPTDNLLEFDGDDQYMLENTPEFTVSFLNLKTFWRFISLSDDAILTTKNRKWSSRNGFVEITNSDFNPDGLDPPDTDPEDYMFPNPTIDIIKEENNKYYSEIFI